MASDDNKALYSKASKYYVSTQSEYNSNYEKSKKREKLHNAEWEKHKVNINIIIDKFAPDFEAKEHGSKMIFYGDRYNVIADMAAGYLRIYDSVLKRYIKIDGNPGKESETHYKIMKREEM